MSEWIQCTIRELKSEQKQVVLSQPFHEMLQKYALKLPAESSIRVQFGAVSNKAALHFSREKEAQIHVSSALLRKLKLPPIRTVNCRLRADRLEFGPFIGILTAGKPRTPQQPFGNRSNYIKSFLRAGQSAGYYMAFSLQDINWDDHSIDGFFLDEYGDWVCHTVPFPSVIHNRIPTRALENSEAMKRWKSQVHKARLTMFNWDFFDKWEVYSLLMRDANANRHMPETHLDPDEWLLGEFMKEHELGYLKPVAGCLGLGIFRITKTTEDEFRLEYGDRGKNQTRYFRNVADLLEFVRELRGSLRNYVIQEGIRLMEWKGTAVDFRVHLNKNGENRWLISGIAAKRAGKGSVTTHVRNGGELIEALTFLKSIYAEPIARQKIEEMARIAIHLACALEREIEHPLGEIGFDMGIDTKGHIWMFEANAKPGRSIFKLPELKNRQYASLKLLFDYSVFLSSNERDDRFDLQLIDPKTHGVHVDAKEVCHASNTIFPSDNRTASGHHHHNG